MVLGGGVGLLVVSLAESSEPATDAGRSGRGDEAVDPPPEPDPEPVPALEVVPEPELVEEPEPVAPPLVGAPTTAVVDVASPEVEHDPPLPRVRQRGVDGPVPSGRTAVEGRYDEVASAPLWRRIMAVLGILVITVTSGVAIAAILGATIAAAAEVLNNTIG